MDEGTKEYSIQKALRHEFETADRDRAVEIYHTSYDLGFYEQAEEMKSDIKIEFNIKID